MRVGCNKARLNQKYCSVFYIRFAWAGTTISPRRIGSCWSMDYSNRIKLLTTRRCFLATYPAATVCRGLAKATYSHPLWDYYSRVRFLPGERHVAQERIGLPRALVRIFAKWCHALTGNKQMPSRCCIVFMDDAAGGLLSADPVQWCRLDDCVLKSSQKTL